MVVRVEFRDSVARVFGVWELWEGPSHLVDLLERDFLT